MASSSIPVSEPVLARARRRGRSRLRRIAPYTLTVFVVAAFFAAWQYATDSDLIHRIILPEPGTVFEEFIEILGQATFRENLWVTLREVIFGFLIGCSAAIVMALVSVGFPLVRKVLQPYMTAFQAVPKIVFVPLFAIMFGGVNMTTAIVVVALVAFFPTYVNTYTGLMLSAEEELRLLHSLGASRGQAFWMCRIPRALPLVFTGLKTSINYGVLAAITTEFLGASSGLGYTVNASTAFFNLPAVYASVAAITLVAGTVYIIVEIIDRKLIFWRVDLDKAERGEA